MAATVQLRKLTGVNSSITSTNVTAGSARLGTSDEATSASSIPVPTSGSNYSYWATFQLNCTVAPDNSLTNIFFYTDGTNSFGTGVDGIVIPASGYASAVGTAGSSGSLLSAANYTGSACAATSPLFLYTSACKLTLSGSIGATTGSFGNRAVVQLNVLSTAVAGNSGEETSTWTWDEA